MTEFMSICVALLVATVITTCGLPVDPEYVKQAELQCEKHGGVQLYWAEPLDNTNQVNCKDEVEIEFKVK